MTVTYKNGAIAVEANFYEKTLYDVANNALGAQFDGCGGVPHYGAVNETAVAAPVQYLSFAYNGKVSEKRMKKTVTMVGRIQKIETAFDGSVLTVTQFLSETDNAVFTKYEFAPASASDVLTLDVVGNPALDLGEQDGRTLASARTYYAATADFLYVPKDRMILFSMDAENTVVKTVFSIGEAEISLADFDEKLRGQEALIAGVDVPRNLSEAERAAYLSAYFCALENFKTMPDFSGFMAGCRYLSPVRSYYRDSYFTVLPMYNGNRDKIKAQIRTLARGIKADGSCPSAVKFDYGDWWGDHFDSPSFLAMMLYDYVKNTGDATVIGEKIGDDTVLERATRAISHLATYADGTHLLKKEGRYNRRDWADEVNRYGYVTYDEVLYARALFSLGKLYALTGEEEKSRAYFAEFDAVKNAVNELLWDEARGYYVNFKNEDYTEGNLSIDTVFAVLFGIAEGERAKTLLSSMEAKLESRHNGLDVDFGSLCVYPLYGELTGAWNKSSQPFNYHNGANWPHLTALYAYAKKLWGMEYRDLLSGWFTYNAERGNFTPVEYFSPYAPDGSLLQAWVGAIAFALDDRYNSFFD